MGSLAVQRRENIDLDAEFYTHNCQLQSTSAGQILKDIDFNENSLILDVGCGDGAITSKIAEKIPNGHVIGIDSSRSMIELAQNKYDGPDFRNVSFLLKNAEHFSCQSKFDYIVSFSAFHWMKDAENTLQRLCSSLKPNGELLLLTYPAESEYYKLMQRALEKSFPEYADQSALHTMLSIDQYKKVLNQNNMKISTFEARELRTKDSCMNAVKNFVRGWLTSYVPLPTEYHDAYLDQILLESTDFLKYDGEGNICLPYTQLLIRAKK